MDTINLECITRNNLLHGLDYIFGASSRDDKVTYIWEFTDSGKDIKVSVPKKEIDEELEYIRNNISFDDDFCMFNRSIKKLEKIVQPLNSNKTIIATHKLNPVSIEHSSSETIIAFLCYLGKKKPTIEISWNAPYIVNGLKDLCSMIDLRSIQTTETIPKAKNDLTNVILYLLAKKHSVHYIDTICKLSIREPIDDETIEYDDLIESYRYRKEPLRFYLQAFSFSHPMMRYLAFYHVIEFFLGTIQEQNAIQIINDELENESWKNDSDHRRKIYKKINEICLRRTEIDQLNDCLESYIPESKISKLFDRISELSPGSENYYAENKASFATAEETRISRNQTRTKNKTEYGITINRIATRIYKTRNYFVHSKDDDSKGLYRYEPFEHDVFIEQEMPLIQSVAEAFLEANRQIRKYYSLLDASKKSVVDAIIAAGGEIRGTAEIAKALGITLPTAKLYVKKAIENNEIEALGTSKNVIYKIIDNK